MSGQIGLPFAHVTRDGTLRILDPSTGECSKLIPGQRFAPMVVQYNPDPKKKFELACGNRNRDNAVTLWDKQGDYQKSPTLGAPVCSISFDAQGGVLAVAADRASLEDILGRPPPSFAGLPPLVQLKIWDLETSQCRLTISHVVLHSEKDVAISPNGRLVAVCVARLVGDIDTFRSSGRRFVCEDVVYELRIYSLEEPTFGDVIASQNRKMVSNLSSIQFSPTSEHLLLAFGGKMNILNVDRILEVRTVPELELVWHLDDATDSVNVALFHPVVGQGLVYCTRRNKFHILMADLSRPPDPTHD
ncbi:hypothetical protein AKJ16_DCAP24927 [Drosera capensis]